MQVIWSYIKELVDSFFDENLKKIWAMFKGTFKTLFTIIISPCYAFPLPKKHILDEVSNMSETDDLKKADKSGFLNDINFTKNTILIILSLVVSETVTSTVTESETNTAKILSIFFYFLGFLVFLGIGRLWVGLFGDATLKSRRIDGWFSLEYNMLFLLVFMADYLASNILGMKNLSNVNFYSMLFVLGHVVYLMVSLQQQTKKQINAVYYWGVNIFLVIMLTLSVVFTSIIQTVIKEDLEKPKQKIEQKKKIEQKEKTNTQEKNEE